MKLRWTPKAVSDLARLHDFLAPGNREAAARIVQKLVAAPSKLKTHPRLGERLEEFAPRDIRRLLIGDYELRYEVEGDQIFLLRIWHSKENRF